MSENNSYHDNQTSLTIVPDLRELNHLYSLESPSASLEYKIGSTMTRDGALWVITHDRLDPAAEHEEEPVQTDSDSKEHHGFRDIAELYHLAGMAVDGYMSHIAQEMGYRAGYANLDDDDQQSAYLTVSSATFTNNIRDNLDYRMGLPETEVKLVDITSDDYIFGAGVRPASGILHTKQYIEILAGHDPFINSGPNSEPAIPVSGPVYPHGLLHDHGERFLGYTMLDRLTRSELKRGAQALYSEGRHLAIGDKNPYDIFNPLSEDIDANHFVDCVKDLGQELNKPFQMQRISWSRVIEILRYVSRVSRSSAEPSEKGMKLAQGLKDYTDELNVSIRSLQSTLR